MRYSCNVQSNVWSFKWWNFQFVRVKIFHGVNKCKIDKVQRERDLPLLGAKYKLAPSTVIPTSKYLAENPPFTASYAPSSSSWGYQTCFLENLEFSFDVFFVEREKNTNVFPKQALFFLVFMLASLPWETSISQNTWKRRRTRTSWDVDSNTLWKSEISSIK